MTRQAIYSNIAENCSEAFGTTGEESESFAYYKLVNQATDDIADKTRCNWQTSNLPIIANQASYCAPQILEMQAITLFTSDGNIHLLDPCNEPAMDDWAGSSWRRQSSGPQPNTIIVQGTNQFLLSPAPDYNSVIYPYVDLTLSAGTITTDSGVTYPTSIASSVARPFVNAQAPAGDMGLFLNVLTSIVGGFQQAVGFTQGAWAQIVSIDGSGNATLLLPIGTAASTGGAASLTSGGVWIEGPGVFGDGYWDAMTAECPLPERSHMAVVWLASAQRVVMNRELPLPEKQFRQAQYMQNFKEICGKLERSTRTMTYASRVPSMVGSGGRGFGAWDSTFGNPLNN